MADKNTIIKKLEDAGYERVKSNLEEGLYSSKSKILIVKNWLRKQEEQTWMYHELKLPKGKIFIRHEVPLLIKQGWVDTPAKFGIGIKNKTIRLLINFRELWKARWPILLPVFVAILGLAVQLFIYFDSKSASESNQEKNSTKTEAIHIAPQANK